MRRPAVAGQFYAGDRDSLLTEVEACYASPLGPGALPGDLGSSRTLRGLVVPHAGFMYSGPVAAHAYLALAKDGLPETVVILGPNHTGYGMPLAVATEDFETPLGVAQVNRELSQAVVQGALQEDIEAHRYEHSLEVQLPFLVHLSPQLKFVFICMGVQDYQAAAEVGSVLSRALKGQDVLLIASTDLSHYVPREVAARKDALAIEEIVEGDARGLYDTIRKHNVSMCGYGPVMAVLEALDGPRGELLKYGSSGDVQPMRDVVGYGSLSLR